MRPPACRACRPRHALTRVGRAARGTAGRVTTAGAALVRVMIMALVLVLVLVPAPAAAGAAGAGDAARAADPPPRPVLSAAAAAAALDASDGEGIILWDRGRVPVAVTGTPTPRDLEVLDGTLAALSAASGVRLVRGPARATSTARTRGITVHYVPAARWPTSPDVADGTEAILGLSDERSVRGALRKVDVYLDPAQPQAVRNATTVHEVIHALGPGHVECPGSVLNAAQVNPSWELSPYDRDLVAAWYASRTLAPAASDRGRLRALRAALRAAPEAGVPCPEPAWAVVDFAAETFWCATGTEPRPCVAVDGSELPSIEQSSWWYADGYRFDSLELARAYLTTRDD